MFMTNCTDRKLFEHHCRALDPAIYIIENDGLWHIHRCGAIRTKCSSTTQNRHPLTFAIEKWMRMNVLHWQWKWREKKKKYINRLSRHCDLVPYTIHFRSILFRVYTWNSHSVHQPCWAYKWLWQRPPANGNCLKPPEHTISMGSHRNWSSACDTHTSSLISHLSLYIYILHI